MRSATGTELARDTTATVDSRQSTGSREFGLRRLALRALDLLLPFVGIGLFLVAWNWGPLWLGFQTYEVPTLSQDIQALGSNWGQIWLALQSSIADALVGFALGNILAVGGAILFTESSLIQRTFYPLAIVFYVIPIVVIGPLSLQIFAQLGWGPYDTLPIINTGLKPILLVTVLITFFPALVNMTVGLRAIDPNLYELMQLIGSSRLRSRISESRNHTGSRVLHSGLIGLVYRGTLTVAAELSERTVMLFRLRLPSSMPYLFSSLKITSTLCFVGAFVGEYTIATDSGIAGFLKSEAANDQYPPQWAAVLAFVMATLVFFGVVTLAERFLVPWKQSR